MAQPSTPAFTTALDTYIARDEPAYKWEKISEKKIGKNLVTTLKVTSQTWQNIEWTHRVEIARPEKIEFPGWAMLYLSTTSGVFESILTQSLATKMGAITIHVMGIPNQPLFGKREDALMAHTFSQFIDSKDDTWPLLLPMTKGANKVMDAVQEYSARQQTPLHKFIVTGASKRGWTAWLIGATDTKNRIGGIIPMVYDNLNLKKQEAHQLESWGEYSPYTQDYRRDGLKESMSTPRGEELAKIIDPYTYRARLTMPKLIVNATNDPLWTLDSLNLYWKDLPAPKNVYYAPNVGHTMEGDLENVFGTSAAWFRLVAGGKEIPTLSFEEAKSTYYSDVSHVMLATTSQKAASVRIWIAQSKTRDFRKAKWESRLMKDEPNATNQKMIDVSSFASDKNYSFIALFVEAVFDGNVPLHISSPLIIQRTKLPVVN